MRTRGVLDRPTRRELISRGMAAAVVAGSSLVPSPVALARDYGSRREALDDLDRLAAGCGMRLGAVNRSRVDAQILVPRFLASLQKHRVTREDVRTRFSLPKGVDPASQVGEVDGDLKALRQSLDDLMVAYAESLPVFGDSRVVSRLAVDMVDISRLRTVIDLWVESEAV